MKKLLYVLLASFTICLVGCSSNESSQAEITNEDLVVKEDVNASFSMSKNANNIYTLSVKSDRLDGFDEGRIKYNILFYDDDNALICEVFVDKLGWGCEIFPECLFSQNSDSNKNKSTGNEVTIKIPNKSMVSRIDDATSYEVVIDASGSEYDGILTSGAISK